MRGGPAQRGLSLLLGLAGSLLLFSCGSSSLATPQPHSSASTASRTAAAQTTLHAVSGALLSSDRPSYQRQLSSQDPEFTATTARIFDNLTVMPLRLLDFHVRPLARELTAQRRALLGPSAWVQQVAVTWQLVGDSGPAQHLLWITFRVQGGSTSIAGTSDGPTDTGSRPLWLVERVASQRAGRVTVVVAEGRSTDVWARRGKAAAAAARHHLTAGLGAGWRGDLVLEVPADRRGFERVLGVTPGSYAQIAAVAWPEGPDAATAAVRIVVNSDLASQLDESGLAVLLAHEATHAATRSAASPAPMWLVEGFADYVAYAAYPRTAGAAADVALSTVRSQGTPQALPTDDEFSATNPDLRLAYAESWLACRLLAEEFSAEQLNRFYLEVDSGSAVEVALRSIFSLSVPEFTSRLRGYLQKAAQGR
ncbi:MAG: hypothetical protein H0T91_05990 [Propionibacteriaceae bacterium]|nr:hypothetical protein [Propionibacteriaceae bacterium]